MFMKYLELCVYNMVSIIRSECNIEKEKNKQKLPQKWCMICSIGWKHNFS